MAFSSQHLNPLGPQARIMGELSGGEKASRRCNAGEKRDTDASKAADRGRRSTPSTVTLLARLLQLTIDINRPANGPRM